MKTIQFNIKSLVAFGVIFMASCTYDFPEPDAETLPTAGTADFTKMISVGNSLTAGFMDNALYDRGQANSFVSIIANQLKQVGGGDFNQPDINAVNGCYNTAACAAAGRLYLKGLASPKPTPKVPGDPITAYSGDLTALNNFGVPGATIGSSLSPLLSANPFYNRIASDAGTSSLIQDAATALADGGTFFTFWLGNNDVLGHALAGASAGGSAITSTGSFSTYFNIALDSMLAVNDAKGAVANIPDVTTIPFFTTVKYNPIPLDNATATYLQTNLANGYNAFLDYAVANLGLSQAEADKRYISFATGANKILITDETLTDLSGAMAGPFAGLGARNMGRARQTTSADLVCLTAGSYIGTAIDVVANPSADSVLGVSYPLHNSSSAPASSLKGDDLILLPTEITLIQTAVSDFNDIIEAAVDANSARLVFVDANAALAELGAIPSPIVNGIKIESTILPPYGAFSLDGVHPNGRGSAYLANVFIEAINDKFEARIPLCNPNDYPGNDLPIP